jgi:hypothetical protein
VRVTTSRTDDGRTYTSGSPDLPAGRAPLLQDRTQRAPTGHTRRSYVVVGPLQPAGRVSYDHRAHSISFCMYYYVCIGFRRSVHPNARSTYTRTVRARPMPSRLPAGHTVHSLTRATTPTTIKRQLISVPDRDTYANIICCQ